MSVVRPNRCAAGSDVGFAWCTTCRFIGRMYRPSTGCELAPAVVRHICEHAEDMLEVANWRWAGEVFWSKPRELRTPDYWRRISRFFPSELGRCIRLLQPRAGTHSLSGHRRLGIARGEKDLGVRLCSKRRLRQFNSCRRASPNAEQGATAHYRSTQPRPPGLYFPEWRATFRGPLWSSI